MWLASLLTRLSNPFHRQQQKMFVIYVIIALRSHGSVVDVFNKQLQFKKFNSITGLLNNNPPTAGLIPTLGDIDVGYCSIISLVINTTDNSHHGWLQRA